MISLAQDVRYAARSLRRRPLLAIAAIASLALGIGVNTAIFSVFDRMVLGKLSIPEPDEIVLLSAPGRKPGGTSSGDSGRGDQVFSYPLFRDLEHLSDTGLTRIAAHRDVEVSLGYRGRSATGSGLLVSGGYFDVLGLSPSTGRLLTGEDDRVLNGHPVVVLTHDYWTTRFGADPRIVGEPIAINGRPYTIVGVGPRGFTGTTLMDRPDVFVPLAMAGQVGVGGLTRRDHWAYLFGRLKPGVTRAGAERAINGPFTALVRGIEFEELRSGLTDAERPQFLARRMVLVDGSRSRQQAPDEVRRLLSLMMVVTGLVLLIACANVANLLMARATDRSAEIAIRLSIGASTTRLVRLLLVEAILLGVAGSAGALAVAAGTHTALLALMPAADVAALRFDLNRSVLLFTVLVGIGTSVVFGLYPAWHGVWTQSNTSPVQGARGSATRTATRFRTMLATAQIGLATALLATAALFASSLTTLNSTDVGLDRHGVIAFRVAPHLNGYDQSQIRAVYDRLTTELRSVPSVISASATSIPVLADEGWNQNVTVQGVAGENDALGLVSTARIDAEYFQTLGVLMLAGREFTAFDTTGSPRVAIVNRAFVQRFGLGHEAVGRRLGLGAGNIPRNIEIVGVAADAKYSSVRDETPAQLFLPYRQSPAGPMTFYARTASDVARLREVVPSIVARVDPNLAVDDLQTLEEQIWENVTPARVLAALSSSFAMLAAMLAGIGLYAVLAFTVAQRLKEFGIRMALGAAPRDVRSMIVRHVARMAAIGTPIGMGAAAGLAQLAASLLYGVGGRTPLLIGGAAAGMLAIMVIAAAVPVRRAMRVEPVAALRLD